MDESAEKESSLLDLRRCLKQWESKFKAEHGFPPAASDIKSEPSIFASYKAYNVLKTCVGKVTLKADGRSGASALAREKDPQLDHRDLENASARTVGEDKPSLSATIEDKELQANELPERITESDRNETVEKCADDSSKLKGGMNSFGVEGAHTSRRPKMTSLGTPAFNVRVQCGGLRGSGLPNLQGSRVFAPVGLVGLHSPSFLKESRVREMFPEQNFFKELEKRSSENVSENDDMGEGTSPELNADILKERNSLKLLDDVRQSEIEGVVGVAERKQSRLDPKLSRNEERSDSRAYGFSRMEATGVTYETPEQIEVNEKVRCEETGIDVIPNKMSSLSTMKVVELRKRIKDGGSTPKGNKAELLKMLGAMMEKDSFEELDIRKKRKRGEGEDETGIDDRGNTGNRRSSRLRGELSARTGEGGGEEGRNGRTRGANSRGSERVRNSWSGTRGREKGEGKGVGVEEEMGEGFGEKEGEERDKGAASTFRETEKERGRNEERWKVKGEGVGEGEHSEGSWFSISLVESEGDKFLSEAEVETDLKPEEDVRKEWGTLHMGNAKIGEKVDTGRTGTWGNPVFPWKKNKERVSKGAKRKGGASSTSRKSGVKGRDNFVRLNINGKGGKRRFINGTKVRRGASYSGFSGGGKRRYGFKKGGKWKRSENGKGKGEEIGFTFYDEMEEGGGTRCSLEGECFEGEREMPRGGAVVDDECKGLGEKREGIEEGRESNVKSGSGNAKEGMGQQSEEIDVGGRGEGPKTVGLNDCERDMKEMEGWKGGERERLAARAREDPTEPNLRAVLKNLFGFDTFRDGQVAAIQRILAKESTLLVLPTGAGKSLCYQLPAAVLPGVALVISPLVALMADQVRHLPPSLPGECLTSFQSPAQSRSILSRLQAGDIKVLFVSPERLCSKSFASVMAEIPISFAVVDEAHCITEWSHNFRPSYFRLGRVLRSRLKVGAVLAATATATARTEGSILAALEIPRTAVIRSENVRKNITLSVSRCSEEERKGKLLELLKNEPFSSMKSSIVYCTFQTDADHLARFLTANGIRAKSYHAGKNSEERRKIQQSFCSNRLPVVVATVAFGMGLDKSDVGAVIHCSVPRSLEHYVQEVGRAGRDGAAAFCHLFLIDRDYLKLRSLAHSAGVDENAVHNFLLRLFKPPTAQEGEEGREGELGYRSLAIESTSKELDIKEEVMHTILAYLEAEDSTYVRVMSPINVTCDITFHQKSPQQIAERNPLIGQILKRSTAKAGHYVFNVPMVARHMAESPMAVMNELYRLKAQGAIGWSLRDPALLVEVLRQPPCLRQLAAAMAARLADVERCKVEKLDCMYKAAARAATAGSSAACQVALQERISAYFQEEDCGRSTAGEAPDIVLKSSPFLRADIKVFLRSNEHMAFTGRAIARIFHGIWSPAFPYGQWADNSFWGRYMNVDFYETRRTVTMELLSLREENRRPADER